MTLNAEETLYEGAIVGGTFIGFDWLMDKAKVGNKGYVRNFLNVVASVGAKKFAMSKGWIKPIKDL